MSRAHPRRDLRHPRRRHRPDLPAPRERDRPEPAAPTARRPWPATGCTTASSTGRRREDVEVARQLLHASRELLERVAPGEAMRFACCSRPTTASRSTSPRRAARGRDSLGASTASWTTSLHRRRGEAAASRRTADRARALADDLNTPAALAVAARLAAALGKTASGGERPTGRGRRRSGSSGQASLLGLLQRRSGGLAPLAARARVGADRRARSRTLIGAPRRPARPRTSPRADAIREGADAAGVVLEDRPDGRTDSGAVDDQGERALPLRHHAARRRADARASTSRSPTSCAIARELDGLGIDYVEGGWPGANPTDDAFFAEAAGARHATLRRLRHDPAAGPQRRQRSRPRRRC